MSFGGNTVPSITNAEHIGPVSTGDNIAAKRVASYDATDGVNWVRRGTPVAIKLDDTTTANVTYVGKAAMGGLAASAVWQIMKIDETSGLVITWADGNGLFDNIWDNRATSVTYS